MRDCEGGGFCARSPSLAFPSEEWRGGLGVCLRRLKEPPQTAVTELVGLCAAPLRRLRATQLPQTGERGLDCFEKDEPLGEK